MAKFFRRMFGTERIAAPSVADIGENIYIPQTRPRGPEEERLWRLSTGGLAEAMERPTGALTPLGQAFLDVSMRKAREQAAPGFFARGLGGQAGEAGLGAFMARRAPEEYLRAFGAGEDIERGRREEARGLMETGLREREFAFRPEEYKYARSQLMAGIEAGRRAREYQEQLARMAERRKFWTGLAGGIGTAIAGGGKTPPYFPSSGG